MLLTQGNAQSIAKAKLLNQSLILTPRQICDLELLLNGAFAPLTTFLGKEDYESVLTDSRLSNGALWPMPVMLSIDAVTADKLANEESVVLRDLEDVPLALLSLDEMWRPDKLAEAKSVYQTADRSHPGVRTLMEKEGEFYISGELTGLQLPTHYDYLQLRQTPAQMRDIFAKKGWQKIIAFQTRNPMHRAHFELTRQAMHRCEANLLIHPVVGMTQPGDIDHFTRVRCYEALLPYYPKQSTQLSLLPLAMRMAGPREALWHALIRKNYGCTHFIIGRDHAGPGKDCNGEPFYDAYAAQALLEQHQDEIGVVVVPFQEMVYEKNRELFIPGNEVRPEDNVAAVSGTAFREKLEMGKRVPKWYSFPEVVKELKHRSPPRRKQGFTVFFTGLSGAGKSVLANALQVKLMEQGERTITLLDGDIVRRQLSSELDFSKAHRDINVMRIGYVASEITKHRGIALCAPIAPYAATRNAVREMIAAVGGFIEIHVATPLDVCESRDRKGLYAKAREGLISNFTGINDPYEQPIDPELVIDTTRLPPEACVQRIILKLEHLRYL